MNKSKLENGEVIELKDYIHKVWHGEIRDRDCDDIVNRVEAFITNALNQQREELLGEVKKAFSVQGDFLIPNPFNKDEMIECFGKDTIKEFLTKLEK